MVQMEKCLVLGTKFTSALPYQQQMAQLFSLLQYVTRFLLLRIYRYLFNSWLVCGCFWSATNGSLSVRQFPKSGFMNFLDK
jgi:hypothetical protein